jgi:hypothetical protein
MNIILEKQNNLVVMATTSELSILNGNYATGQINTGFSTESCDVIENVELPQFYFNNCYSYVNGAWAIINQEIYDVDYQSLYNTTAKPIIEKRDGLLYASDWTQIPNNPLTTEQQQAWAAYRQELRDITNQPDYPWSVTFPKPPQQ